MTGKRPALGRGLGALLPSAPPAPAAPASGDGNVWKLLPIEQVLPSADQPRKHFNPERLTELADSIRHQGIVQPIVVSPHPSERGTYVIVAGERRWRAAQLAGLHEVPVVVRKTADEERLELALVENLQRADLNPVEEASAFNQLMDLRGYTHEQLAGRIGKDRSTVSNALRLLRLPEKVQEMLKLEQLSMGHARALLGLERESEMLELAREVARTGMSVRATERAVRKRLEPAAPPEDADTRRRRVIVEELEDRLRRKLGVRARLRVQAEQKGTGVLEIPYSSLDELDRILAMLLDDAPN